MQFGSFVLIDGKMLVFGILFLVLGKFTLHKTEKIKVRYSNEIYHVIQLRQGQSPCAAQ